jgi:hypothetical protein
MPRVLDRFAPKVPVACGNIGLPCRHLLEIDSHDDLDGPIILCFGRKFTKFRIGKGYNSMAYETANKDNLISALPVFLPE